MTLLLLAFAACTKDDTAADDSTPDSPEGDADTDTDTDSDTDVDDSAMPTTASLKGVVTDEAGNPVSGARVNVCKELCKTKTTDSSGAYSFPELEAWTAAFDVVPPAGKNLATPLMPLTLADEEDAEINVVLPVYTHDAPIPASSATEINLAGVHVTVAQSDLTAPFGTDLTTGHGVDVPSNLWLPYTGLEGTPIATFYLAPFDAKATGLPFWVENKWGLTAGTEVKAWAADYDHQTWASAGTLTVSEDGTKLTNDGTGIPVVGTLVLVQ